MSFALPRGVILPVDARRRPARPLRRIRSSATMREAIAENWRRETVAKPALFDGTVVLLSALGYRDRRLVRPLPCGALLDLHAIGAATAQVTGPRTPSPMPMLVTATMR